MTDGERAWALGEIDKGHPEYADVVYFTPDARLRAVWLEVHGESIGAWMAKDHERWHLGQVIIYGAIVGFLDEPDKALLHAGVDPWAQEFAGA